MALNTNLRARVGAVSRWHPQAPELIEWRSELSLDAVRETIYSKLIAAHRRELGRELLGLDQDEAAG